MSSFRYGQFEILLRRRGFVRTRNGGHGLWQAIAPDGTTRRVVLCNSPLRAIPRVVLLRLLKQAGLTETDLRAVAPASAG